MRNILTFFSGIVVGVLVMGVGFFVMAQGESSSGTSVRLLCGGDVGCLYTPQTDEQVNDLLPVVVPENDLLPVGEPSSDDDLSLEWRMVCIEGSGCLYTPYTDDQLDDLLPIDLERYFAQNIVPEGTWTIEYEGTFNCPDLTIEIPYDPTIATFNPQDDDTLAATGANPDGTIADTTFYNFGPGSYISNLSLSQDGGYLDSTTIFVMTSETTLRGSILGTITQEGQTCSISTTMTGTRN